jgi:lambda repressor-like predicted transcriptional regulator
MEMRIMKHFDISPEEIRFLLNRKGSTFAQVDRKHGLKSGVARKAARHPYRAGEIALATTLSIPPERLWPSRYNPLSGERLKPQPGANYTNHRRLHTSQNLRQSGVQTPRHIKVPPPSIRHTSTKLSPQCDEKLLSDPEIME